MQQNLKQHDGGMEESIRSKFGRAVLLLML